MNYCPHCKRPVEEDICPECGADLRPGASGESGTQNGSENREKREGKMSKAANWYAEQWQWQQEAEQKRKQKLRQRRNFFLVILGLLAAVAFIVALAYIIGAISKPPEDAFFSVPTFRDVFNRIGGVI